MLSSINSLKNSMDSLKTAIVSINSMLIDFLGVKEVVSEGKARFLMNEVKRLASSIVLNVTFSFSIPTKITPLLPSMGEGLNKK